MELLAADVPSWVVSVIAFLFGATWGSFFNVAIYRWPREMSVVSPPSHCPACGGRIPARWNVPIAGYLLLRGKAACCDAPLSPRYPVVEALSAVLCVAVAQRYVVNAPPGSELVAASLVACCYFIFLGGLLIATFVDLEHMEIPDEVTLPGAALGLATAEIRDPESVGAAALGAGGGFLFIQVLFVWVYERMTGRRGMGEGDSKLIMMVGAFEGWRGAAFALFAGAAQGIVVFICLKLTGQQIGPGIRYIDDESDEDAEEPSAAAGPGASKRDEADETDGPETDDETLELSEPPPTWVGHHKLPFGPFLALGAIEYLFFGDALIEMWFEFVGAIIGFS